MRQTLFEQMKSEIERNRKGDENIGKKVGASTLLVREIGRGAMGAVYLGYDAKLDRQVAVKVLLREMFADVRHFELLKTLLVQEGRNLAKVKHRGVVEVYELDDQFPAIVMELIENGEDLQTFLYRKKDEWATTGFRLWFLSVMEQIAFALGAAHAQGVIHKDLKFGNVMIFKDSEGEWRTKVIDFGLAQNLMHIKLTHGMTLMGSPSYMAPEQWEDHWAIDAKADVYSFGVMLYEVLMQRDFHESEAIEEIKANAKDSLFVQKRTGHLPIDQRTIFEFLLAIERSRRAGGMLEVVGVLRNLRLAITYRDKEAPGTSFPPPPSSGKEVTAPVQSSHKMADQAEAEFEGGLETPPPVSVPFEGLSTPMSKPVSSQKPKPPMRGVTLLGPQVSAPPSPSPSFAVDIEFEEPPPVPASQDIGEGVEKKMGHGRIIIVVMVLAMVFLGIGYFRFFHGDKEETKKPVAHKVEKSQKAEKVEAPVIEPIPSVDATKVAEAEKPDDPKPTDPKPEPDSEPIPISPAPPTELGEFPSNEYATHLFREWDKWCAQNDARKAEFEKFPMWRAMCLRKKAVELYQKDRSNPETAVAMADEVWAHTCFRVSQDKFLAKECEVISDLARKRFTYFLKGERIHAVDQFLTGRRPRRLQIQEEWKSANSTENPPATP